MDRCEEPGHGKETERREWEPQNLLYEWVLGAAAEAANLSVAKD